MIKKTYTILILFLTIANGSVAQSVIDVTDYGELLDTVQKSQIFSDQKAFVDFAPENDQSPSQILKKYNKQKDSEQFDLQTFVGNNFDTALIDTSDVLAHIDHLWDYLTRKPDTQQEPSSLISLPHPYVVPGGRFREVYYWDSYFTMLGLAEAGKTDLIKNMLDNFAWLIRNYGHIPNGNRSYYLSRSQPPFFSLMIELYADLPQTNKKEVFREYRGVLKAEYDFWMKHAEKLNNKRKSAFRVVYSEEGGLLNRYWDNLSSPRPESYLHDIKTQNNTLRGDEIYRDIRAAAESGWDFSSRWFGDEKTIGSIQTTNIIPIDLNCLLYHQELILSDMYGKEQAHVYEKAAERRKENILETFWSEEKQFFFDYDFHQNEHTSSYNLAALYPLFFNIADTSMARGVVNVIEQEFLKDGGLVTTLNETGEQWDYPNGWPPLQWVGYKALKNYGYDRLAETVAERWIDLNIKVFFETNKMMEKYDVVDVDREGGGGEYELQDGFGWTNGVFLKLWNEIFSIH